MKHEAWIFAYKLIRETSSHTHTHTHTYIHTLEQVPGALSAADTAPLRELALARIRDIEAGLKKEGVDIGCGTNGKERPCTMVFMNCFITTTCTAVVALDAYEYTVQFSSVLQLEWEWEPAQSLHPTSQY